MSFLNRFFDETFDNELIPTPRTPSMESNSFQTLSDAELAGHLEVDTYGEFQLTSAVRPAADLKIRPTEGYRHDVYTDEESGSSVPVVMASVSRENLFHTFVSLVKRLGTVVDVVIETSHDGSTGEHIDMYREHIDMPVLLSALYEFEDLLTNDGCTGIAVLNPNTPQEVQFDEHKLLIMYGSPLEPFEHTLEVNGLRCNEDLRFITEAEHIHSSTNEYREQFESLRTALGLDGSHAMNNHSQNNDDEEFV
ncbi:MAG: hypothetical protein AAF456_06495 [Planctomycetota bacterium]